jgi:hypothetical protein
MTAKDHEAKAINEAIAARNARRAGHATLLGGIGSNLYGAFTGRTLADKDTAQMEAYDAANKAIGSFSDAVKAEALKNGAYGYLGSGFKDSSGRDIGFNKDSKKGFRFNAAEFSSALSHASGPTFTVNGYNEVTGQNETVTISTASATSQVVDDLTDSQIDTWQDGITRAGGTKWEDIVKGTGKLRADYDDVKAATKDLNFGNYEFNPDKRDTYGKVRGEAKRRATRYRTDMKYVKRRANSTKSK